MSSSHYGEVPGFDAVFSSEYRCLGSPGASNKAAN